MGNRRAAAELRRDAEFAAFSAGAAGRLLHTATLLTGDPVQAEQLLTATLARTYTRWLRLRADDPYDRARAELVRRFSYRPWWRRPRGGILAQLTPQERLVVTLRYFEGVAEEQVAAQLGLPAERVRAIAARATATLRSTRHEPAGAPRPRTVAEARQRAGDRRAADGAGPGAAEEADSGAGRESGSETARGAGAKTGAHAGSKAASGAVR